MVVKFSKSDIIVPMSSNNSKNKYGMTRKQEKEAGKLFGKYVTKEKALVLGVITTLVCLMPIMAGLRLWHIIPETVETGLIGTNGRDDSMPREILVFGIPGLMAVLNIICHAQLYLNQKAERLAPQASRIVGRWGFPVLSALFASGCILSAAGEKLNAGFIIPCILSLTLLLLGSHFFDCKKDAKVAFHFSFMQYNPHVWRITHRIAGIGWMLSGLLILFCITFTGAIPLYTAPILIFLIAVAFPVGIYLSKKDRLKQ